MNNSSVLSIGNNRYLGLTLGGEIGYVLINNKFCPVVGGVIRGAIAGLTCEVNTSGKIKIMARK